MKSKLTIEERRELVAALSGAFETGPKLDDFAFFQFDQKPLGAARNESKEAVIRAFMDWVEDGNLDQFLSHTATLTRDEGVTKTLASKCRTIFEAVVARAPAGATYTPPNAYETCLLTTARPFINRKTLRQAIRRRLLPGFCSVLLVNGDRRHIGRRYTISVLEDLSSRTAAFGVAWVDISTAESSQMSARELHDSLSLQMDLPVLQYPREEAEARYAHFLAMSLDARAKLKDKYKVWFLVLKGFDNELLPTETRQFISHLIERAVTASRLRLVLLGYRRMDVPPVAFDHLEEDILTLPSESDLESFFLDIHQHQNQPISPAAAKTMAAEVLAASAGLQEDAYRCISESVHTRIGHLL